MQRHNHAESSKYSLNANHMKSVIEKKVTRQNQGIKMILQRKMFDPNLKVVILLCNRENDNILKKMERLK